MKSFLIFITAFAGMVSCVHAENSANGSNANGNEKVCAFGPSTQNEIGQEEVLKKCQRGDVLSIGWLLPMNALQLCDFSKAFIVHPTTGNVIGCVYSGSRRPILK